MKHYITVTGTKYRYGTTHFEKGEILKLIKEPENDYDKEAIRVEVEGLGKIGYVANSVKTVAEGCMSGGRLYDRIGDTARAKIVYVLPNALICTVKKKDIVFVPPVFIDADDEEVSF